MSQAVQNLRTTALLADELARAYAGLLAATARADEALRSGTLREHEIAASQARALTNRVERIEVELGVLRYAVGTTDADVDADVTAA